MPELAAHGVSGVPISCSQGTAIGKLADLQSARCYGTIRCPATCTAPLQRNLDHCRRNAARLDWYASGQRRQSMNTYAEAHGRGHVADRHGTQRQTLRAPGGLCTALQRRAQVGDRHPKHGTRQLGNKTQGAAIQLLPLPRSQAADQWVTTGAGQCVIMRRPWQASSR